VDPGVLFAEVDFDLCLKSVSHIRQSEILAAKFYKDRCQRLAGTLLTNHALRECGYVSKCPKIFRTELGRPFIESGLCDFNVTHTSGLAAVAVGPGRVGLDAERIVPLPDLLELAEKNFASDEYELLNQLRSEHRLEFFYHLWTAKESLLKAIGSGFSISANAFSVVTDGNIRASLKFQGKNWFLHALPDANGCKMALCTDVPVMIKIENLIPSLLLQA
jgi:4'-phosphopantetheinyl transferase